MKSLSSSSQFFVPKDMSIESPSSPILPGGEDGYTATTRSATPDKFDNYYSNSEDHQSSENASIHDLDVYQDSEYLPTYLSYEDLATQQATGAHEESYAQTHPYVFQFCELLSTIDGIGSQRANFTIAHLARPDGRSSPEPKSRLRYVRIGR